MLPCDYGYLINPLALQGSIPDRHSGLLLLGDRCVFSRLSLGFLKVGYVKTERLTQVELRYRTLASSQLADKMLFIRPIQCILLYI